MSKCSENILPLLKEPNESLDFNMDSDILELEMNIDYSILVFSAFEWE